MIMSNMLRHLMGVVKTVLKNTISQWKIFGSLMKDSTILDHFNNANGFWIIYIITKETVFFICVIYDKLPGLFTHGGRTGS